MEEPNFDRLRTTNVPFWGLLYMETFSLETVTLWLCLHLPFTHKCWKHFGKRQLGFQSWMFQKSSHIIAVKTGRNKVFRKQQSLSKDVVPCWQVYCSPCSHPVWPDYGFLANASPEQLPQYILLYRQAKTTTKQKWRYTKRRQIWFWARPWRTHIRCDNFMDDIVVPKEWKENFRIHKENFLKLCLEWQPFLEKKALNIRAPVQVERQVAAVLYRLSEERWMKMTVNALGHFRSFMSIVIQSDTYYSCTSLTQLQYVEEKSYHPWAYALPWAKQYVLVRTPQACNPT